VPALDTSLTGIIATMPPSAPLARQRKRAARTSDDGHDNMPKILHTSTATAQIDKSGLYDIQQVKRALDDNMICILEDRGYEEATGVSNVKIISGVIAIIAAVYSHFNSLEFPDNRNLILACVSVYMGCVATITALGWLFERNSLYVGCLTSAATLEKQNSGLPPRVWAQSVLGPAGTSIYTIQLRATVADSQATEPDSAMSMSKSYEAYFSADGDLALSVFRDDVEGVLRKLGAARRRKLVAGNKTAS
jgi:Microsomal signal peptidase 25 kDa subunit (SPC25)